MTAAGYQYAGDMQAARYWRHEDEKAAGGERAFQIGTYAYQTAAVNRATAEAAYQYVVAGQARDRLEVVALLSGASGQQQFDYQRAEAQLDWLEATGTAFVLHSQATAYAEEYYRPYILAKNPPPQADDPASWPEWVSAHNSQQTGALYSQNGYAGQLASLEQGRQGNHLYFAGELSIQRAKAAGLHEIDKAKAEKTFAMASAERASSDDGGGLDWSHDGPAKQRTVDLAKAQLDFTIRSEDQKLLFQQRETNNRQLFSKLQADFQKQRDTDLANNARSAALPQATYQYQADWAFASAQAGDWRLQTSVDNDVALQRAIADVAFWTVQEQATVAAVEALDTHYELPWTEFLVAQAEAHQDWWGQPDNPASAAGRYVGWTEARTAAKSGWQIEINREYGLQATQQRNVHRAASDAITNVIREKSLAETAAAHAYAAGPDGALDAGKIYLDASALANRNFAVNVAAASYRHAVKTNEQNFNGDAGEQYSEELQQASVDHQQALQSARDAYTDVANPAVANRIHAQDSNERSLISAVALAVNTESQADTSAAYAFAAADARLYAALVATEVGLDKAFKLAQLSSLQSAMAALSSSPWANYLSAQLAARAIFTSATTNSLATTAIAIAHTQAGIDESGVPTGNGEIGAAAALRDADVASTAQKYLDRLADLGPAPQIPSVSTYPEPIAVPTSSQSWTLNHFSSAFYAMDWLTNPSAISGLGGTSIGLGLGTISGTGRLPTGGLGNPPIPPASLTERHEGLPPPITNISRFDRGGNPLLPLTQGMRFTQVLASGGKTVADQSVPDDQPLLGLAAAHDTRNENANATEAAAILLEGRAGPPKMPVISFEERQAAAEQARKRFLKALGFEEESSLESSTSGPPPIDDVIEKIFGKPSPRVREPSAAERRAADARRDAKLGLFDLTRSMQRARLERELAELKAQHANPAQIEHVQRILDNDYKHTKPLGAAGNGIIKIGDREIFLSRTTPEFKVREMLGTSFSQATFHVLDPRVAVDVPLQEFPIAAAYADPYVPVTKNEFFSLTQQELRNELARAIDRNEYERDPMGYWKKHGNRIADKVQEVMDFAGMIPVVGDTIDVVNGLIYILRGRPIEAGASLAATIPLFGTLSPAVKRAVQLGRMVDDMEDSARLLRELCEIAEQTGRHGELAPGLRACHRQHLAIRSPRHHLGRLCCKRQSHFPLRQIQAPNFDRVSDGHGNSPERRNDLLLHGQARQ